MVRAVVEVFAGSWNPFGTVFGSQTKVVVLLNPLHTATRDGIGTGVPWFYSQFHSHTQNLLFDRAWASQTAEQDPTFFNRLCELHAPDYMWIG